MISNQSKKYLELKQKSERDVRQLGPIVQFRDNFLTVDGEDEYNLSFSVPMANRQLFKLHVGGALITEGPTGFEFVNIANGRSSRIKLTPTPIDDIQIDCELSGVRLLDGITTTELVSMVSAFSTETFANCVVGTAHQVNAGRATHTSVQTAINDCPVGGKILVLEGTYIGALTINKQITLEGKGRSSVVDGTLTCQSNCDFSIIKHLKFTDTVTFQAGANENFFRECFLATGKYVVDYGTVNSILYIGE